MRSTDGLPPDITALIAALDGDGLNTWGVAPAAELGDVLPGARSVLVFGSGGGHLWRGFCTAIVENATTLTNHTHPFDSHVARCVAAADAVLDADRPRRWVLCGATEPGTAPPPFVDFRMLAREAGLGHPSRLGLLMGPVYGPWMGLRAACVLDDALDPTGPLPGDSPCLTCAAPCVPVCPVGAVPEVGARAPEDPRPLPFGIRRCAAHRASGGCATQCGSRNACPEGSDHRYDALEQHYHDNRGTGRKALAAHLGIDADGHPGLGPRWAEWAEG